MECGLTLPSSAPPLAIDPHEPSLRTSIDLDWPGRKRALVVDALIDTGCPVDFIASPRLSHDLRAGLRPTRMAQLVWGERVPCEIYRVGAWLDRWVGIEVYSPLTLEMEDLLGLPALLKGNLCIRGAAGSAYWARLPDRGGLEWVARESDPTYDRPSGKKSKPRVRRRQGAERS